MGTADTRGAAEACFECRRARHRTARRGGRRSGRHAVNQLAGRASGRPKGCDASCDRVLRRVAAPRIGADATGADIDLGRLWRSPRNNGRRDEHTGRIRRSLVSKTTHVDLPRLLQHRWVCRRARQRSSGGCTRSIVQPRALARAASWYRRNHRPTVASDRRAAYQGPAAHGTRAPWKAAFLADGGARHHGLLQPSGRGSQRRLECPVPAQVTRGRCGVLSDCIRGVLGCNGHRTPERRLADEPSGRRFDLARRGRPGRSGFDRNVASRPAQPSLSPDSVWLVSDLPTWFQRSSVPQVDRDPSRPGWLLPRSRPRAMQGFSPDLH